MFFTRLCAQLVLVIGLVICQDPNSCQFQFDPKQYSIQNGNGGFSLDVRDNDGKMVEEFQPLNEYKLIVKNYMSGTTFNNFTIRISSSEQMKNKDSLGRFIYPKFIEESPSCPGSLRIKGNRKHFSVIEIKWRAPQYPEKCIEFQAAVVMSPNLLYQDQHHLKKKLCANQMFTFINNSPVVSGGSKAKFKKCCACGTASYLVTFRGLWNKTTHPRDWPQEKGQLHWTDPIGATHNHNYMIYNLGVHASQAVSRVCTMGDSKMLKDQLMSLEEKENVKSLYSSRWMNGESQLNEERSGYVSVNNTHHLFSFISMMGPSPDWCTGVSGIDLCMEGCKWQNNLTIPLFPFDAGVQSGETYKPINSTRLINPDPIREINRSWMKDSPFTPNKPVAEMIITRVTPISDSQCEKDSIKNVVEFHNMPKVANPVRRGKHRTVQKNNPLDNPVLFQMTKFLCGFSQWTNWSPCSVDCGLGESTRSRQLTKNLKNELCILLPRQETKDCEGQRRMCDYSSKCSLLPWSSWSPCSATCKKPGKMVRTRQFAWDEETENCLKNLTPLVKLNETKVCHLKQSDSRCNPLDICSAGKVVRCINNKSTIRFFYRIETGKCEPFQYYGCKGSLNNFKSLEECESTCSEIMQKLPESRKTGLILLQSETSYSEEKSQIKNVKKIPNKCFMQIDSENDCKDGIVKAVWYYNHRVGKCLSIYRFSCYGNFNKFETFEECMKVCDSNPTQNVAVIDKVDCKVSNWSQWGPCSTTCGQGKRLRIRSILKDTINGGTPCPILYESGECYEKQC